MNLEMARNKEELIRREFDRLIIGMHWDEFFSIVWDMMADFGFPAPPHHRPTTWQEVNMYHHPAMQLNTGFEEHYMRPPHLLQPPVHYIPSPPYTHAQNNDNHFVLQEHMDLLPVGLIDGNMVYEIPTPQPQQPLPPPTDNSTKKRRRKRKGSQTDTNDSASTHTHSDKDAPAPKKNGLVTNLLASEPLDEQDQTLTRALSVGEELLLMLEQMKPLSPPL